MKKSDDQLDFSDGSIIFSPETLAIIESLDFNRQFNLEKGNEVESFSNQGSVVVEEEAIDLEKEGSDTQTQPEPQSRLSSNCLLDTDINLTELTDTEFTINLEDFIDITTPSESLTKKVRVVDKNSNYNYRSQPVNIDDEEQVKINKILTFFSESEEDIESTNSTVRLVNSKKAATATTKSLSPTFSELELIEEINKFKENEKIDEARRERIKAFHSDNSDDEYDLYGASRTRRLARNRNGGKIKANKTLDQQQTIINGKISKKIKTVRLLNNQPNEISTSKASIYKQRSDTTSNLSSNCGDRQVIGAKNWKGATTYVTKYQYCTNKDKDTTTVPSFDCWERRSVTDINASQRTHSIKYHYPQKRISIYDSNLNDNHSYNSQLQPKSNWDLPIKQPLQLSQQELQALEQLKKRRKTNPKLIATGLTSIGNFVIGMDGTRRPISAKNKGYSDNYMYLKKGDHASEDDRCGKLKRKGAVNPTLKFWDE